MAPARRFSPIWACAICGLLTNNPAKRVGLEGYGLQIVERVPLQMPTVNAENQRYMNTKRDKMGHLLDDEFVASIAMNKSPIRTAATMHHFNRITMKTHEGNLTAAGLRIAIVAARFNDLITETASRRRA